MERNFSEKHLGYKLNIENGKYALYYREKLIVCADDLDYVLSFYKDVDKIRKVISTKTEVL